MDTTQIVAWWGAVVATLVLLWDVVKWLNTGPKIKKRITLNNHYGDGRLISEEKTENGTIQEYEEYCHIELVNIGNQPTTIMNISGETKIKSSRQGFVQDVFIPHFGKKLPHVLSTGEVWSCRLPMSHYEFLNQENTPEVHIHLSHMKKPLVVTASKAANKALKCTSAAKSAASVGRSEAAPLS